MLAISFGETSPVDSNDTPEGRKKNRRIEILLRPVAIQMR
jgi:flagellar motor protein MotB